MQYTSGDASKLMTITPVLNKLEHQPPLSTIFQNGLRSRSNTAATLGRHNEALDFAVEAQCLSPYDTMAANKVENVKKHLAAVKAEKKAIEGGPRSETRTERELSWTDILYRSQANNDSLQDGPRSEREDSDFVEELELDFGTSISGDSTRETGSSDSCGSPSSSSQNGAAYQPEAVIDMKRRYAGHCNVGTDIKQASFLGQRGEFVASGSDDGRWFIWEKQTGRLIKMLLGDDSVVNCVQCHPFDCFVATSGIDNTIKLWTPTAAVPSMVAGVSVGPEAANVLEAMESNQRKLCHNLEAFLPFELLQCFRMHEFSEGSLQPFECTQS